MNLTTKIALTFTIASVVFVCLPVSPFNSILSELEELPYLPYLNWFFPVGRCLRAFSVWGLAVSGYYSVMWILRQFGFIGS